MTDQRVPLVVDGQVAGESTVYVDDYGVHVTAVMYPVQEPLPDDIPAFSFRFVPEPELDVHDPLAVRLPLIVSKIVPEMTG